MPPTSRRAHVMIVVAMAVLASVAFAAGVPALVWAGQLAALGAMAWALPIVLDGSIIMLTAAWWHERSLGRSGRKWAWLIAAAVALSAAIQVAHARTETDARARLEMAVALVVSALPPIVTLIGAHAALELRAGRAPSKRRERSVATSDDRASASGPDASSAASSLRLTAAAPATQVAPSVAAVRARRLTPERDELIVALRRHGKSFTEIAAEVGCGKATVDRVLKRQAPGASRAAA